MPLETLAVVMAEQAVGLALGATILAVTVPKRNDHRQTSNQTMKSGMVVSKGPGAWYGKRWVQLIIDVQDTYAARNSDGLPLASVLASLGKARVLSNVPGRARLYVKGLKGEPRRAQITARLLMTITGVYSVRASEPTGSLLIHYDTKEHKSLNSVIKVIVSG